MKAESSRRYRKMLRLQRKKERYGPEHHAMRAALVPMVLAGLAVCARCQNPIPAGSAWDLGHDDVTGGWSGPEHIKCNRGAPNRNKTSQQW